MEALLLLVGDHNRIRGLFARFRSADDSGDTDELAALGETIIDELDVHTTVEEEIFYPAVVRASSELCDLVAEGVEEHRVVRVLAGEIAGLTPGDRAWTAELKVLIDHVEHHAGEEEQELFPKVRRAIGGTALTELGRRMEVRKATLGAPTAADKDHLTVSQLRELACAQAIPGRSGMSRDELLASVSPG